MASLDLNQILNGDGGPEWQAAVQAFVDAQQAKHRATYDLVLAELPEYRLRPVGHPSELQKMLIREDGREIYMVILGHGTAARNYGTLHFADPKWAAENLGSSVLMPWRNTEQEAVADVITGYLMAGRF